MERQPREMDVKNRGKREKTWLRGKSAPRPNLFLIFLMRWIEIVWVFRLIRSKAPTVFHSVQVHSHRLPLPASQPHPRHRQGWLQNGSTDSILSIDASHYVGGDPYRCLPDWTPARAHLHLHPLPQYSRPIVDCDELIRRTAGSSSTHRTRTSSSSPASLLYSGKVRILLPLSVLLTFRLASRPLAPLVPPLEAVAALDPVEVPVKAAVEADRLRRPEESSSAVMFPVIGVLLFLIRSIKRFLHPHWKDQSSCTERLV